MIGADRLAVQMRGEQKIILQRNLNWQVDGEAIFRMLHQMRGAWLDFDESIFNESLNGYAFPLCIYFAPACDAVNIYFDFRARKLIELIPRPFFFFFHFAPYAEVPCCRIERRHGSIMQHGEFHGQRLTRRQPAFAANAIFFLAAVGTFK